MSSSGRRIEPIPFTVIGGYLGAGKTTLLNRILRHFDASGFVVLVNDFGALNIDAELIDARGGKTYRLENGCICCNIGASLISTLLNVVKLNPRPQRVIVEASGVADPSKIADIAHLSPSFSLDDVIVIVDGERIQELCLDPHVGETVVQQLRSADLIVLNKQDLVADETWPKRLNWVQNKNTHARIWPCCEAQVPLHLVFSERPKADKSLISHKDASVHDHGNEMRSWCFEASTPLNRQALEVLLNTLPVSIHRAKGFVCLADEPNQQLVLQWVGGALVIASCRRPDRQYYP